MDKATARGAFVIVIAVTSFAVSACGDRSSGASDRPFPVTAVLEWTIDGHAEDLVSITRIVPSSTGIIHVSQGLDRRVLAFGPDGTRRGSFGRQGAGPGEFESVGGMGIVGDTLWIWDRQLNRITWVNDDLDLVRTENWRASAIGSGGLSFAFATLEGMTPNGSRYLALEAMPGTPESAIMRRAIEAPDGTVERMVVEVPRGPSFAPLSSSGGTVGVYFPFAILPMYAVSHDGRYSALVMVPVSGDDVGTIEVTVFDERGEERYRRWLGFDMRDVPRSEADSIVTARADGLAAMMGSDIGPRYRRLAWIPPFLPPVDRVTVGGDGSVWLRMSTDLEGVTPYRVVDPDRERVGVLDLPAAARVLAADEHRIRVVIPDETGVESIASYVLSR